MGISGNRSVLGRPTLATAVGSAGAQCGGFGRCFRTRPRCHPPARRNQSRKSPRKPTRGSIAPGDLVPRAHQSQRSRGSFETSTVQQAAAGHRYFACHAKIYSGLFFFIFIGRRFLGSRVAGLSGPVRADGNAIRSPQAFALGRSRRRCKSFLRLRFLFLFSNNLTRDLKCFFFWTFGRSALKTGRLRA